MTVFPGEGDWNPVSPPGARSAALPSKPDSFPREWSS